jgi:two-component system response regulator YesN
MELNVLIVDDEPIVCKGLKETVPWDEWGVRVVGEAHDGEEALKLIACRDVDLVLSDIRMPGMNGLELSREVCERYPGKRIVMLSGYDDFEYARQALRLGVKDYLLKPVDIGELMFVIRNIRRELAEEREKKWREAAHRLLSALAVGERGNAAPPDLKPDPDLKFRFAACLIGEEFAGCPGGEAGFAGDTGGSGEADPAGGTGKWAGRVEEILNTGGNLAAAVSVGPRRLLVLSAFRGPEDREDGKSVFRRMAGMLRERHGLRVRCCLSPAFGEPEGLDELCRRTIRGLSAWPVMEDAVYEWTDVPEPERLGVEEEAEAFRALIERGCDGDTLRMTADGLFVRLRERRYGLDDAAEFLRQLADRLFAGLPARQALHAAGPAAGADAGPPDSYDELQARFVRDLEPFVIREGTGAGAEQRMLVDKALRYMREHYNKDLKAAMVASRINVSPNYFSQLLKKVTGRHFNDLLHEIRVEKAKQLLAETECRIFQVGRLVGYKEYKYFVQTFKRLTNVSPSRYRMMAYQAKGSGGTDAPAARER